MAKIKWTGDNLHPPAIIVVDLGNNFLKAYAYIMNKDGSIRFCSFSMPHGYRLLSDSEWHEEMLGAKSRSRIRGSQSHVFKIVTDVSDGSEIYTPVSIGKSAYRSPDNSPLLGSNKYIRGGIDALLCAVLCELFPESDYPKGHNNLIVGYGFPPTEWQQTELIDTLINKTHRIVDAKEQKRAFRVRASLAWDENVGGLVNAMSYEGRNPETGTYEKRRFETGDRVIVFDSGGWLGSMAWAVIDDNGFAVMDYDSDIVSIDGGASTVRADLRIALKRLPELSGIRDKDLTDDILDEVLRTGKYVLSGDKKKPLDVSESVQSSLSYLTRVQTVYRNVFAGGRTATHILMTGGTINPLYEYLKKVFNHTSIHLAGKRDTIYMANGRGGMGIVLDRLIADDLLPEPFKAAMDNSE